MTPTDGRWPKGPQDPTLRSGEIHVWRSSIRPDAINLEHVESLLSPDEQERSRRFIFERDRVRFVGARGALRTVLGRYLKMDPAALRFEYGPYGKPRLEGHEEHTLHFNVSHSHDVALVAVHGSGDVGVDVERIRTNVSERRIASRFFSRNETAELFSLPERVQHRAFFHLWTCKEAYIKARGMGIAYTLHAFDVSADPGKPAALLADRRTPDEKDQWHILALNPKNGYAGAVVTRSPSALPSLSCWSF